MKVEIIEYKKVTRTIDIEFPYYYEYDLYSDYGDSVIYGKIISKDREITIHETEDKYGKRKYEIEEDSMPNSYFTEEHKSSKAAFENAKRRALDFLNNF